MDFNNRNALSHQDVGPSINSAPNGVNVKPSGSRNKGIDKYRWNRIGIFAGFLAVVILFIAIIVLIASNNSSTQDKAEATYIKPTKLQAVFLNTGQVYFGYIKALNNNYLVLTDIYYLQTSSNSSSSSSTNSASNVTLVKLGCEIHRPYDQMVINRSAVTFWENLQSDGQVAQAVSRYQAQNPSHSCTDQSSSASTSSSSTAQPSTTNK
jgi:hypothetical protein